MFVLACENDCALNPAGLCARLRKARISGLDQSVADLLGHMSETHKWLVKVSRILCPNAAKWSQAAANQTSASATERLSRFLFCLKRLLPSLLESC